MRNMMKNKYLLFLLLFSFAGIQAMQLSSQDSRVLIRKEFYTPNQTNGFLKEAHFSSTGALLKKIYDDLQHIDGLQKAYFHPKTKTLIKLIANAAKNTTHIKEAINNEKGQRIKEYYDETLRTDGLQEVFINPQTKKWKSRFLMQKGILNM